MAFQLQYFGQLATGQGTSFTINYALQNAIAQGTCNGFVYNGLAAGDVQAALIVADYFLPVTNQMKLGDFVLASATDANVILYVSAITYSDNDGKGASVTLAPFSPSTGTVTTDDIVDHAVTYVKMQQEAASSLLGNPTGVTANVQAVTLGSGLAFTGSVLNTVNNGTVTSVSGTTNRITSTGGATPVIDVSASYVGQTSITTLGTIGTGVWNGSLLSPTFGGTGTNNGLSSLTLGGNTAFSGAHTFTGTLTADTSVTFPTSGTLATTAAIPAFPLSPANGGTGLDNTTYTLSVTANSSINQDVRRSAIPGFRSVNLGYTSTATANANTIITSISNYLQFFTGTLSQRVYLPETSELVEGQSFFISNKSTLPIIVYTFEGDQILPVFANASIIITCVSTVINAPAAWNFVFFGDNPATLTNNISSANAFDLTSIYAAPALVIANPDPLSIIYIEKCILQVIYISDTFTGGGNVKLQYGSSNAGSGLAASTSVPASTFYGINQDCTIRMEGYQINPLSNAAVAGQGIYISNSDAAFASGAALIAANIWYSTLQP